MLKENLKACGWKVLSIWAMGDELDAFLQAGEAEVNLVVSSVGLRAAKVLEEKFGTPYVVGTPVSYTHLDVYKRQGKSTGDNDRTTPECCSIYQCRPSL